MKVHEKNCYGFRDKENDKSVSVQTINCSPSIFPTSSFTMDPVNQGEIFTLEEILARSITKLCKYLKERHGYQVCSLQSPKNLGGRVALPSGKFLRVRKVFARPESFCA